LKEDASYRKLQINIEKACPPLLCPPNGYI